MSDDLMNELRSTLAEVVGKDVDDISPEDDLVERLGVDSLTGLKWLAVIEKRYDLRFPDERLSEYRSLEKVREFIVGQGKGGAS